MREELNISDSVYVTRDANNVVRGLSHRLRPFPTGARTAQAAAEFYLQQHRDLLDIDPSELKNLSLPPETEPNDAEVEYRLIEERPSDTLTTVGYQQTYFGLPVWQAGLSVHLDRENRVLSVDFTGDRYIRVTKPSARALGKFRKVDPGGLLAILNLKDAKEVDSETLRVNNVRLIIYRYDAAQARPSGHAGQMTGELGAFAPTHPTLPVPPVPDEIKDGQH